MPEEVKQPVNATPSESAQQGSAPVEKVPATTVPTVEAGTKTPEGNKDKAVQGLKTDLFKARSKARDAEEHTNKLASRLEALEQSIAKLSSQKPKDEIESWGEVPADNAKVSEERIASTVIDRLTQKQAEYQKQVTIASEKEKAQTWLLSRSHFREDPNALSQIAEILQHPKFLKLNEEDPDASARTAYQYWCEERGVIPDFFGRNSEVPSNGIAKGGSKAPTSGDAKLDVSMLKGLAFGSKEYEAAYRELEQAGREGKLKGKTIKL